MQIGTLFLLVILVSVVSHGAGLVMMGLWVRGGMSSNPMWEGGKSAFVALAVGAGGGGLIYAVVMP